MAYNSKYTGAQVEAILDGAADKVDKVEGKGLSTNDYTNEDKAKVAAALTAHQQLKTVNGKSLVGSGDIIIEGGSEAYDVSELVGSYNGKTFGEYKSITESQYNDLLDAVNSCKIICGTIKYYDDDPYDLFTVFDVRKKISSHFNTYIIELLTYVRQTKEFLIFVFDYVIDGYKVVSYRNIVPEATSQLTNDSGFITSSALSEYAKTTEVESKISEAVASLGRMVVKHNVDVLGFGTDYNAGAVSIELAADEFHIVGRTGGLALTLPDGADTDGKEYVCQFYVGSNFGSYTFTLPDTVAWLNGTAPTFESANTCYMLSIVNNCAVCGVFKQSA